MDSYNNDLNPGTAMLIKIVRTVFCFSGLGWIYSGQAGKGILLLLGYWVILAVELFYLVLFQELYSNKIRRKIYYKQINKEANEYGK